MEDDDDDDDEEEEDDNVADVDVEHDEIENDGVQDDVEEDEVQEDVEEDEEEDDDDDDENVEDEAELDNVEEEETNDVEDDDVEEENQSQHRDPDFVREMLLQTSQTRSKQKFTCKMPPTKPAPHTLRDPAHIQKRLDMSQRPLYAEISRYKPRTQQTKFAQPFCANLRNRNAHGHLTKNHLLRQFTRKMQGPRVSTCGQTAWAKLIETCNPNACGK